MNVSRKKLKMIKNLKEFIECDRCLGMGWGIADRKNNGIKKCYECRGTGKIEVKDEPNKA